MGIKISAQISISVRTPKMKNALHKYAHDQKTTIGNLIENAWSSLLAVNDLNIKVKRDYSEQTHTGDKAETKSNNSRLSIKVDPHLLETVDTRINQLRIDARYSTLDRTTFTQEAIRRFIEPILIDEGYLDQTIFRDKLTAVNNLETFRIAKGLNKKEFFNQYLKLENSNIMSYSQYSLVIRSGSGNVDRLIHAISLIEDIPEDVFYMFADEFSQYLHNTWE